MPCSLFCAVSGRVVADPHVLCFNAADRWVQAKEPMHADIDTTQTAHAGLKNFMAEQETLKSMSQVDRALKSVESFPSSDGKTVRLRGLLWYQGESDTDSLKAVEEFPSKLKNFFTTFWNQIGAPQDFIIQQVQVTCRIREATKYVEELRRAQLDVGAAMQHPRVWTVDANGLAIKDDGVHLTRESQYILGTALAQQHMAIIAGSASPATPWKCVPNAR
ncbi:probable carbohydrate esterase At4g34215 [Coccomyxa sp. Obi]|nr:probable carbohydrate esterase At4g34215 [Coccomyxa sp. Obi]